MLTKLQKILFAFLFALTTIGAIYLEYQLTMYLYNTFGIMALFCLGIFSILWLVWYLIIDVIWYLLFNN